MRRTVALLVLGTVLIGCDRGPTEAAPEPTPTLEQVFGTLDRAASAAAHPGLLRFAPDSLQLTQEQQQRMFAAFEAFMRDAAPQLAALTRLVSEYQPQDPSRLTPAQREEFLRRATPIIRSLEPALLQQRQALDAILTPAQRAWLEAQARNAVPPFPRPRTP